jgi:hypothetical protein
MDSAPVILEISSDDESSLGGVGEGFDWMSELFDGVDENNSDEVVVVREVNNARRKSKSLDSTARDADDDCVVLDGDPDNQVSVENEVSSGSDELLVVGEKGQVIWWLRKCLNCFNFFLLFFFYFVFYIWFFFFFFFFVGFVYFGC